MTGKIDAATARFAPDPTLVALGRRIFFDPRLSEPRGMSCAGCHDPGRAFAPTLSPASLAGLVCRKAAGGRFSQRNAPSLLYVRYVPRRHFYQDDDAPAPSPFGGLFSDGRADTLAEQIRGPLFDPNEMNNRSPAALLRKIDATELAPDLAARFGAPVRRDPEQLVRALVRSRRGLSAERRDGAVHVAFRCVPAHAQATRAGRNARPRAVRRIPTRTA